MAITVSMLSQGANLYQTTSEMTNAAATDFFSAGVIGTVGNSGGVAPTTGVWGLNANGTPNNTVIANSGTGYVTATPTGQASQLLRVKASTTTTITIAANATGSTVFDWIYMKIDPAQAIAPAVDGTGVASFVTSRSTSSSTDTGTPPSYGLVVGVVTVANGFSTITNGNIFDKRVQAGVSGVATNVVTNTNLETSIRPVTRWGESFSSYIASGCVWTGDSLGSTLNGSMTAGVVYVGGVRSVVAAVTAHAFTASRDTYVYVDNTGAVSYILNTNGATSPSLPANSILIAKIVTGASSIAAASSIVQTGVDSLNNFIGNTSPIGAWSWKSYVPVLTSSGGSPANGNAFVTGHYQQIGKTVHFKAAFRAGTTTNFGSGNLGVTLPVTAALVDTTTEDLSTIGGCHLTRQGIANIIGFAVMRSGAAQTSCELWYVSAVGAGAASNGNITNTAPYTWANTDLITVHGTYEAA